MAKFRVLFEKKGSGSLRAVVVDAESEDDAKRKAGSPQDSESVNKVQKADAKGEFPFTLGVSTLGGPDKLA